MNLHYPTQLLFTILFIAFTSQLFSSPDLIYTEDECGVVIVFNLSTCEQDIYCHEISSDNKVYFMGKLLPGQQKTINPTAVTARVWTSVSGDETSTYTTSNCTTHTLNVNACLPACYIDVENNGCSTLQLYEGVNGNWVVVATVAVGETLKHLTTLNENIVIAYDWDNVVKTIKAKCGHKYVVNDDDCDDVCTMYFRNKACDEVWLYQQINNDWSFIGKMDKDKSYSHQATNGSTFRFKYADGTTINTWTGWCGESYTINDNCNSACKMYFKNEACDKVKLYIERNNDWSYIGSLNQGVSYSHDTHNGAKYIFKYADGSTISTWTGWCGESYIIKDNCSTTCWSYFKNDACEDVKAYEENGLDWVYIGTLKKGVKYQHEVTQGRNYRFKYNNGTWLNDWEAWCGETHTIKDDCNVECDIYFKNRACADLKMYHQTATDWVYIGTLKKGKSYHHRGHNGDTFRVKYADGSTLKTATLWCNETWTITDHCPCDVSIDNRTCDDLEVLKGVNGSVVDVGVVPAGVKKTLRVNAGVQLWFKDEGGKVISSWHAECGSSFKLNQECQENCDVTFANNACEDVSVYKEGSSSAVGSVSVGGTLTISQAEGTAYKIKNAAGDVLGSWTSVCGATFNLSDDCGSPCDDVSITAIKIYDQATDAEVPGIGALTNGMSIDVANLPAQYYITAEVSDATSSVSLDVDGSQVCENYSPYTYPNAAHQGTDWNGGVGSYTITVGAHSGADCAPTACVSSVVSINITESHGSTCNLSVSVSQSGLDCDGSLVLSAIAGGMSTCSTGSTAASCAAGTTSSGYVLDTDKANGCADGIGARLWRAGSADPSYLTVDLGSVIPAGTEICATMKLKHCLNTDSDFSEAIITTSLDASGTFTALATATFSNEEFANICYALNTDARYVRIEDSGHCSFRMDAVSVSGSGSGSTTTDVSYYWINSTGDTISTDQSISVTSPGSYTAAVKDCNGCVAAVEDVEVVSVNAADCNVPVNGGLFTLANGDTSIDICSNDGISDAFDIVLSGNFGESSTWVILDASRNILAIPSGPPFDLEGQGAGLCIICHVSYNGTLTGFAVGQNANNVGGDLDFSNEISVTRFHSGGPCGGSATDQSAETRSNISVGFDTEIFPNPTRDVLYVTPSIDAIGASDKIQAKLFSIDGKLLRDFRLTANQSNELDLTNLKSNQFYMLTMIHEELGIVTERIFKSN